MAGILNDSAATLARIADGSPAFRLVELAWQGRVTMVCQGPGNLAVIDAPQGQRRQAGQVEPADLEGLQRRWRLHGTVAAAQEEQLVHMHRQRRRILLEFTIPARNQLYSRAVIPGFLRYLADDRG